MFCRQKFGDNDPQGILPASYDDNQVMDRGIPLGAPIGPLSLGVVVAKFLATKHNRNQKWPEMGLFWSKIDDLEAEKMKMIRGVRF